MNNKFFAALCAVLLFTAFTASTNNVSAPHSFMAFPPVTLKYPCTVLQVTGTVKVSNVVLKVNSVINDCNLVVFSNRSNILKIKDANNRTFWVKPVKYRAKGGACTEKLCKPEIVEKWASG